MRLNQKKKLYIGLFSVALLLIVKLFFMQIIDDSYKHQALKNSILYEDIYPARGIIYDRNGNIIVGNKVVYDLLVRPGEISEFDTLAFCNLIGISQESLIEKLNVYKSYRGNRKWKTDILLKRISQDTYVKFAEVSYMFPGFHTQARYVRDYQFNICGNLLGYISEVDDKILQSQSDIYKRGDYIGKTGIEAAYEKQLKGARGYRIWLRDSHNRTKCRYKDGADDKDAIPGSDINATIDIDLQEYGQMLMENKVGSLIAIEPSSGEILTLVSSPGIDVEMLEDIGTHYNDLISAPYRPMFNRAIQAAYPPGSVFKLVNALIGIEEDLIDEDDKYACNMGYHFGKHKVGCHAHKSPVNLTESIMMSCNSYYCYLFRDILESAKYTYVEDAIDQWKEYVMSFGFGQELGCDIPGEVKGFIPGSEYYNKSFKKGILKSTNVISLSIGQGELGCTPLQLANLCATIANRGYYYIPHIVKDSEDVTIDSKYKERHYTLVDTTHFEKVINGMYRAVNSRPGYGATATVAAVEGLNICGKTGTAQNPHGKDHSIFICFAPMDNPQIAVAAYIENGGFGASVAAPIASLLVEKYLCGNISNERNNLESRIVNR